LSENREDARKEAAEEEVLYSLNEEMRAIKEMVISMKKSGCVDAEKAAAISRCIERADILLRNLEEKVRRLELKVNKSNSSVEGP